MKKKECIYFFGPCTKNFSEIQPSVLGCQKKAYSFFNFHLYVPSDNLICFLPRNYNMLAKHQCEALNLTLQRTQPNTLVHALMS